MSDIEQKCTNEDCSHICKEGEKERVPRSNGFGDDLVCPKCGTHEFYYAHDEDIPEHFRR